MVKNKIFLLFLAGTLICSALFWPEPCLAKRTIIPVSGKINSFGTYSFTGKLNFNIASSGEQEIGAVTVEGTYNGEYPWIMRVYTDNANYTPIAGSAGRQNPTGLISTDGKFTIPLFVNSPVMGISEYRFIPDINQKDYKPYAPGKLNQQIPYADCIVMAIDPRNELWVAGADATLFTYDDNVLGDLTMPTPFELKFKAKVNQQAVSSSYTANLYIEIVACP